MYPILEFDPTPQAVIEPGRVTPPVDAPEHCVICFFREVLEQRLSRGQARVIAEQKSELGPQPLYELAVPGGRRLAAFHPGVGAPLAAGLLEEVIARGCRKFIACGACGVLDKAIAVGQLIVPVTAVRDEGTSYHYLPPAREVSASPAGVAALEATLTRRGVNYQVSKTWTTDAFFRETPAKVSRRRAEGCTVVEMEAAAFFAVAQFRGVTLAQLLYGGDDVSGADWDHRYWHSRAEIRAGVFELAVEACLQL